MLADGSLRLVNDPDSREALRRKVMKEMDRRMPIIRSRFDEWRGWPGTWTFADVAVTALQDELAASGVKGGSDG